MSSCSERWRPPDQFGADCSILLYKSRYPDVAAAGIDPVLHYVVSGAAEDRNPSLDFDTAAYVAAYPEATRGGGNP